jgi:hypothetical protein
MRGFILFILFVTSIRYAAAQDNILLPEDFLIYRQRMPAVNPAFSDTARFYGVSGYRQYGPPMTKVRAFYFLAGLKAGKSSNYHYSSISVANRKEGPHIDRPAFHYIHSYRLNLSKGYHLTAGLSAGFTGFYFNSPASTGNASFTVFDLNAGLRFSNRWFSAGASVNQIPDKFVQPRVGIYTLPRFYNFDYYLTRAISPDLDLNHNLLVKVAPGGLSSVNSAADLLYRNLLGIGAGFRSVSGTFFYVRTDFEVQEGNQLSLFVTYNAALFSKNLLGTNLYEFTLKLMR